MQVGRLTEVIIDIKYHLGPHIGGRRGHLMEVAV